MKVVALAAALILGICASADAGSFQTLFTFSGRISGSNPYSPLVINNGTLYGYAQFAPNSSEYGSAFSFNISTNTFKTLYVFDSDEYGQPNYTSAMLFYNGLLYGETFGQSSEACYDGTGGYCGTIFSINPTSLAYTNLHTFTSGGVDGNFPVGDFVVLNNIFYGVTALGGVTKQGGSTGGTIFTFDPATNVETPIYSFTSAATGTSPIGGLISVGSTFYGVTYEGGQNNDGTIFKISHAGKNEKVIYSFEGQYNNPAGALAYRDKELYGVTLYSIFKVTDAGKQIWDESASVGADQQLIQIGAYYYGVSSGSQTSYGYIFKINANTGVITTLYTFTGQADGEYPDAALILSNGVLYGTTGGGGSGPAVGGTIFQYTP